MGYNPIIEQVWKISGSDLLSVKLVRFRFTSFSMAAASKSFVEDILLQFVFKKFQSPVRMMFLRSTDRNLDKGRRKYSRVVKNQSCCM